jgi:hypothetical protein
MYTYDRRVWLRRKYRANFNRLVALILPSLSQAGKGEAGNKGYRSGSLPYSSDWQPSPFFSVLPHTAGLA